MSFDAEEIRVAIAQHGSVARVVIAGVKGSVPRDVGASMLVWEGGQSGTIGGGALEFEAAAQALDGPSVRKIPLGPALGQCCGGAVTLVTEVFSEIPEGPVYSRRVTGEAAKPIAIKRAESVARNSGQSDIIFKDGWLSEPVSPPRHQLWIYGAGHVGRALVSVIAPLPDYSITWVDTEIRRFPDDIPDGVRVLPTEKPGDAVQLSSGAHHLIVTYSHALDLELCHRLLSHEFASAGLIGSVTKWARFRSRLSGLGHRPEQIARIQCPIGRKSLGKHPQSIAIGVAEELLTVAQDRPVASSSRVRAGNSSQIRGEKQQEWLTKR